MRVLASGNGLKWGGIVIDAERDRNHAVYMTEAPGKSNKNIALAAHYRPSRIPRHNRHIGFHDEHSWGVSARFV